MGGTVSGLSAGKTVTLLDNGGDAVVVNANGNFQFPTKLAQGKPYAATVGTRPSGENCTVTNGSGTVGTANVTTIAVACTLRPLFGYAVNSNDGTVSAFTLDATTGMPTVIGTTPVAVGQVPLSLTIDPAGKFVYVANAVDSTITTLSIDPNTGVLTVVGSPTTTGASTTPYSIARTPNGKFTYTANFGSNTLSAFSINASTGALSAATSIPAGANPYTVTINSAGTFAYVVNNNSGGTTGTAMAFAINSSTGLLTQTGSTVNAGNSPEFIAVNPAGSVAYVANSGDSTIGIYSITAGALAATPTTVSTGANSGPNYIAISPSGGFLYETNVLTNNLNVFSINPNNGALTLVQTVDTTATSTASNSVGHGPVTVLLNPAGTFAYVVSAIDNSVTAYSINASTGMLTAVANGSAATGKIPRGMAIVAVP
ncbi:40-residue YVTN family beta-propeller repeat-containing protein [Ralstonia sp. NT80]|nr:hypothetical protein C404_22750 [Ralstonia sp. AU12-08]GAQ29075.1 40-residue YVTN family beta-propeller repeat-containing protein [Ralstonia sp. NT80]